MQNYLKIIERMFESIDSNPIYKGILSADLHGEDNDSLLCLFIYTDLVIDGNRLRNTFRIEVNNEAVVAGFHYYAEKCDSMPLAFPLNLSSVKEYIFSFLTDKKKSISSGVDSNIDQVLECFDSLFKGVL